MGYPPPLWKLFSLFHHSLANKSFIMSSQNLLSFSLKPLPLSYLLQVLLKGWIPHLSHKPLKYWKAAILSFKSLLFFSLNNPNSLSCSITLIFSVPLLWSTSNSSMSFLLRAPDQDTLLQMRSFYQKYVCITKTILFELIVCSEQKRTLFINVMVCHHCPFVFFTFNLDPDGEWDPFETKTWM